MGEAEWVLMWDPFLQSDHHDTLSIIHWEISSAVLLVVPLRCDAQPFPRYPAIVCEMGVMQARDRSSEGNGRSDEHATYVSQAPFLYCHRFWQSFPSPE